MKLTPQFIASAFRLAAIAAEDGLLQSRDPLPLTAFLVSKSPIRASIEMADPRCWLIETADGERYAFTVADVEREFADAPWTFEHYLQRRAELV